MKKILLSLFILSVFLVGQKDYSVTEGRFIADVRIADQLRFLDTSEADSTLFDDDGTNTNHWRVILSSGSFNIERYTGSAWQQKYPFS